MSRTYIKDVKVGDSISEFYLVKSKRNRTTRNNKPFLDLDLMDSSGIVNAKVWNDAEHYSGLFQRGDVVKVAAKVDEYQGSKQLKVDKLRPAADDDEFDMAELIKSSPLDPEVMVSYLDEQAGSIKDDKLRELLRSFLDDPGFMEGFKKSAAARNVHHVYVGGLLDHTVKVTRLAAFAAEELYPGEVNRDLLISGAILHDVGKVRELDSGAEVGYTREGYLVGHVIMGSAMLRERAAKIPGFPEDTLLLLEHILVSHHGEKEWGSPVVPMTPEAMIIHAADNLDAKTQIALTTIAEDPNPDEEFTQYHRTLARHFYKKPPDEDEDN